MQTPTTKQLLLRLLAYCEQLYMERYALQAFLEGTKVGGWKPLYEKAISDSALKEVVHQKFASAYELVEKSHDDAALLALLQKLPTSGKIN
jgi:hypothetical protein